MNPAIVLYSIYICTIVHVCPVPVPGVENIVIFLVSSWVRGERLLTSQKMSIAFFLTTVCPKLLIRTFLGYKQHC